MVQQKNMIREIYNLQQRMIQMQMSQQVTDDSDAKDKLKRRGSVYSQSNMDHEHSH